MVDVDGAPNVGDDFGACNFDEKEFDPKTTGLEVVEGAPKPEKPFVEGCEGGFENGFELARLVEPPLLVNPNAEVDSAPKADVLGAPNFGPAGAPKGDMVVEEMPRPAAEGVDAVPKFTFELVKMELDVFVDNPCVDAWASTDESRLVSGLALGCDRGEVNRTCLVAACPFVFPSPLTVVPFRFARFVAFPSRSALYGSSSTGEVTKSAV